MGILSFLFGKGNSESKHAQRAEGCSSHKLTSPRARIKWREGSFPMEVAGESNYQDALGAICGTHTRYGHDSEYDALLESEPTNPYDANAILVRIQGHKIGYLPREQAERVGEQMRVANLKTVHCSARVRGGWRTNQYDEGQYGVRLAIPNHGWIDFGIGAEPPSRPSTLQNAVTPRRPEPALSGPLRGHWVELMGAPSDGEVAKELAAAGARIMAGVGRSTTLLVIVAEQPFDVGIRRSSSFRRAEEMIAAGSRLRIVSISETRAIINQGA